MQRRWYEFWANWGLIARLMVAVGTAVVVGGILQAALLVIEGADDNTARMEREIAETLRYLAPTVAEHALVGDYAAIEQVLKKQVLRTEMERLWWVDPGGRSLSAYDKADKSEAPGWFSWMVNIKAPSDATSEVTAGGVSYGKLHAQLTPAYAETRLWKQFVKQLQIVTATLFLMLQFLWLIFRGNLGTLRNLAAGANRFSQGDHAVRIVSEGAPEVRQAADAFNNMATNTETLLSSLSQSESKNRLLASIVEQSSEAIWTTDMAGLVTSWNAGAAAMFGHAAAEVVGHALKIGTGGAAVDDERMRRIRNLEKFSYESKAMTKAGAQIDIQVAVAPLVGDEGQCVGTIAVARDVTERTRSEDALRAARAAAETANHAKSAFLARMSHEIRTPMNGVLGMTELLLETDLTSTQRKYAETVQRSGTNLLGIINDVLDFSKIEAGKLELEQVNFDVRRTLEDVVDMLSGRAHSKGIELACSIPAGLPAGVIGDPLRVGQVLTNLAGNAIKFTDTGSVLLSVRTLAEANDQITLRFDVKDTGPGISEEAQGRIFEEFSQADGSTTRQHGGSGLGLAISKQLVEMMHGNIHVESQLGAGATFWFTITLNRPSAPSQAALPGTQSWGVLTGVRVLIVESNVLSRGILHSQVSGWGMTTRVAESVEHALDLLHQAGSHGVPFDLAIIDLGFGGGDPLELARAIKSRPGMANLKLVMLAPVGNHSIIQEARAAGLDACLVKPVRQSHLLDALVNVMRGETLLSDARSRGREAADALTAPGQRGSVLLVEDNLVNQAVAQGILNKLLGCHVTLAKNGAEAVEAVEKGDFDLVLMDCHMPVMDGFQATREIRKREAQSGRHTPIIALTANAMAQDREECVRAGMDDHLGKPFSRQQMWEVLERWMPRKTGDAKPDVSIAAPASEPAPAALDQRVLGQLRDLQGNDAPDLLLRVLTLYLRDSRVEMARIAAALEAGDAEQAGRCAHALKSSSANIGALTTSQLCGEIEAAGRHGDLAKAREIHVRLVSDHGRVVAAVEAEIAADASSARMQA